MPVALIKMRTREMAQLVNPVPLKHEDMNLNPKVPVQKLDR